MSGARAIQTQGPDGSFFFWALKRGKAAMKLVMIDNYDSFTHNLVQLFLEFDLEVEVFRNDQVSLGEITACRPDWICISPGPKDPRASGISPAVVAAFGRRIPILGVCLGLQVINEVYGGSTLRAPVPLHGTCSLVTHGGIGLFRGLPDPLRVARYHSLQVRVKSPDLEVLAHSDDGVVMALKHCRYPIHGVQFHPESFLGEGGLELVENFLALQPGFRADRGVARSGPNRFPRWAGTVPSRCRPLPQPLWPAPIEAARS